MPILFYFTGVSCEVKYRCAVRGNEIAALRPAHALKIAHLRNLSYSQVLSFFIRAAALQGGIIYRPIFATWESGCNIPPSPEYTSLASP